LTSRCWFINIAPYGEVTKFLGSWRGPWSRLTRSIRDGSGTRHQAHSQTWLLFMTWVKVKTGSSVITSLDFQSAFFFRNSPNSNQRACLLGYFCTSATTNYFYLFLSNFVWYYFINYGYIKFLQIKVLSNYLPCTFWKNITQNTSSHKTREYEKIITKRSYILPACFVIKTLSQAHC
jgi:hypothetical protein